MDTFMTPAERVRLIVERTLEAERKFMPTTRPGRSALDGIRLEPPDLMGATRFGAMRRAQIAVGLAYMKGR